MFKLSNTNEPGSTGPARNSGGGVIRVQAGVSDFTEGTEEITSQFRKASHSTQQGNCVELATAIRLRRPAA